MHNLGIYNLGSGILILNDFGSRLHSFFRVPIICETFNLGVFNPEICNDLGSQIHSLNSGPTIWQTCKLRIYNLEAYTDVGSRIHSLSWRLQSEILRCGELQCEILCRFMDLDSIYCIEIWESESILDLASNHLS